MIELGWRADYGDEAFLEVGEVLGRGYDVEVLGIGHQLEVIEEKAAADSPVEVDEQWGELVGEEERGRGHSDITIGPALGQSVKQNVRVEVASLELYKFAGFFEVDGTPVRVAAVSSINGDAAPTGVIATGQHVILMEPVDENGGTLAQATCGVLAVVLPRYRGRTVVVQIGREQRRELALDPADINRREGLAGAGRCATTSLDDGFSFGAAQDDSVSGIKHFSGICGGGRQECTHGEHARGQ